ncbi:MAG TPA: LPXTG cell wall anchor domain-containing protein [Acidimicrobiales bacterium]|nr:LPXTG cell wall anchor domain-containing protein [Acidimicrobiales bacterium]
MRMRRFSFGILAACGALLVAVVVVPSAQAQQNAPCGPAYPPTNCQQAQADRQADVQVQGNTLDRQPPPRAGGEIGTLATRSANQRGGGDLPRTGSSSTVSLVSTAVGLVLVGSALVVLRRRRAESSTP